MRRDALYGDGGKLAGQIIPRGELAGVPALLEAMQSRAFRGSAYAARCRGARQSPVGTRLAAYFHGSEDEVKGWVSTGWSRPEGAELDTVVERLKALKLTVRNTPIDGPAVDGVCLFTGKPAVERILIGRTY